MAGITDVNHAWATQVGRFVLAFGSIEHTSLACLDSIPRDAMSRTLEALPLGVRLDLLIEILEGRTGQKGAPLLGIVLRAKSYLTRRNLIAHNSVWYSFARDGDKMSFTQELISSRDVKKRLSLLELTQLADEVEALARAFTEEARAYLDRTVLGDGISPRDRGATPL